MTEERGQGGNRVLTRAAAILEAVDLGPATATDIARSSGLSTSTAHRLALAMVETGFLERRPDGAFQRGVRFQMSALEQAARLPLSDLRDATGESAQLWVRHEDERVCVLTADSARELRATLPAGARLPLPGGSAGGILSGDPDALEAVRRDGWFESIGRRTPDLASVSAPVVLGGTTIAAICLAMPRARLSTTPGAEHGTALLAAVASIDAALARRASF